MRALDRELQRRRVARALPFVPPGSSVIDIGCHDGAFFRAAGDRVVRGVGIDTTAPRSWPDGPYDLRIGRFPDVVAPGETFDVVVALAVVEHVPRPELDTWAAALPGVLVPGGRVVVTTPSPRVDAILDRLISLRALDGMDAGAHHGFDPLTVPDVLGAGGLTLERHERFELGLNHLFVFRSPAAALG